MRPFIGQTVGYPRYKFWSNRISLGEHYLGDAFRIAGDAAVVAGTNRQFCYTKNTPHLLTKICIIFPRRGTATKHREPREIGDQWDPTRK